MTSRTFVTQLLGLAGVVALFLILLHQIPALKGDQSFSWISWVCFLVWSIVMFFLGKWSAADSNKSLFVSMSILLGGGKMLFSILLVILYSKWAHPASKGFVIPFFLVYLSFTIFETYFMMKLAKGKIPVEP